MERILTNLKLVTMAPEHGYQVIDNAMVIIRQGKISYAGSYQADQLNYAERQAEIIDCRQALVTPGFIDCHTHLVFAGNRANEFEQRLNGVPYEDIAKAGGGILSTVRATREATEDELFDSAMERLAGLKRDGVTTVEIKSGYGLTSEDELKMLRVARRIGEQADIKVSTTLLAAHALPPEFAGRSDAYIDLVCDEIIPAAAQENLADAVDVFCEGIGFSPAQCERVFNAAIKHGLMIKGHTEQLSNLGGSALAAEMGAKSVDHIEYLDEAGVEALAKHNTVATLLPGAFYFLRETQQPPVALLREKGVPMAISTDFNPGTSPIASLKTMMNMACTFFRLTPEECLRGVTANAAQALGRSETCGQIREGMAADLALWRVGSPAELSYRMGVPDLIARVVDGEFFYQPENQ
ncbi:imidazolonepropionase [Photobacterium sp. CCB-ST2H9]|uniref:imidazolonepropionase n=1 Tax=Photobacterium sp. CCB-ST2H9 TaxID=2912855 RepID=UPI002004A9F7|nr:imidazolonepropionase [Photobacterium sp. CCB-ST2H9]UTM55955.1 imidazolonepropionase [Photobacterium sp. CCB-ST2H9]